MDTPTDGRPGAEERPGAGAPTAGTSGAEDCFSEGARASGFLAGMGTSGTAVVAMLRAPASERGVGRNDGGVIAGIDCWKLVGAASIAASEACSRPWGDTCACGGASTLRMGRVTSASSS
ncbi:hypothetical protein G4177_25060 [Corallococcus sp. ZKHCc1 1396]|uniref:Uncharacterized protein n=1 Tax=Corallococcus soli TaxID=2710757 RepID=A0ABR9PUJ8_9BACT|nr:hypothetical protein [Corallococcus soli]MBE4751447.1 hypothetical protein [Corallococcus soli]